jgi:anti-sigma factor RsiW
VNERLPICELDLLAYADDPLGLEPRRRQAVEAHLRSHPEDAALVAVFRRQNAALRERYDRYLHAPVPVRLYEALEARPTGGRRFMRRAAAACILPAALAAGWVAGERHGGLAIHALEENPSGEARQARPAAPWADEPQAGPVAVAGLLEYGAGLPDLGHLGFALVAAEQAAGAGAGAARLTYGGEGGRSFTLLLSSRWHDRNPGFQVERRGELSVVSWEEGRLAAEITARLGREEALEIAEAVRSSLAALGPGGPLPPEGQLAAGSPEAADHIEIEAGAPVVPQRLK